MARRAEFCKLREVPLLFAFLKGCLLPTIAR
jgi:hypothetical protein